MITGTSNVVRMEGIERRENLFSDKDGKRFFDFNALIPIPDALRITAGDAESLVWTLTEGGKFPVYSLGMTEQEMIRTILRTSPVDSDDWVWGAVLERAEARALMEEGASTRMFELGDKYVQNFLHYGVLSWMDWCPKHWGTDWNSSKLVFRDEDTIQFETAGTPEPVICKLAEAYPDLSIDHWWAGGGFEAGHVRYDRGRKSGGPLECNTSDWFETNIFCCGRSDSYVRTAQGWTWVDETGECEDSDSDDCD